LTQLVSDALGTGGFELGFIKEVNKLSSQTDNLLKVRHADLGFNPATKMIELRFEMTTGAPQPADILAGWTQFYNNAFDTVGSGVPWAIFFDQRLGTTILKHTLTKALDASGKFSRDGELSASWNAVNTNFHTNVEGEVIDACYCLTENVDLDVRVWGDLTLTTVQNKLHVDVRFDWKVTNVLEEACCILTAIVFFPLVGIDMLTSKKTLEWWEYLIGLVLYPYPVLLVIAAIMKFSPAKDSDMQPEGDIHKDPNDDKHYWAEFDLPKMKDTASCAGVEMSLGINAVTSRGDGIVLGGLFNMPPIVDPVINVKVVKPFTYVKPHFGCNSSSDRPQGFEAILELTRTEGNYDFHACDVSLVTLNKDI
jgi:hypothetical protein